MLHSPIDPPRALSRRPSPNAAGIVRLLLIALAFVGSVRIAIDAVYLPRSEGSSFASDFKVFWTAARVAPEIVYDADAITKAQRPLIGETGPRPFVSPPSLLAVLKPLGALPFWTAFAVWSLLAVGALALAGRKLGAVPLLFLLAAPALHFGLTTGQVTPFVTAALLAGLALLPTRPTTAALLFAAAALLKPQTLVLLPFALAASGHWRVLAITIAAGAAGGLACLLVQGPALWTAWLTAMAEFPALLRDHHYLERGISPASLAARLELGAVPTNTLIAAAAALGIAACLYTFRRIGDPATRGAALVCGYLLCTPYAMIYEALALVPAAAMMLVSRDAPLAQRLVALFVICLPIPSVIVIFAAALLWMALKPSSSPASSS